MFLIHRGVWHLTNCAVTRFIYAIFSAKQSCPVLSLKFAPASFVGLLLYSVHFVDISPFLFCGKFVAFLFVPRNYFAISIMCSVVPFLASLSHVFLPSSPKREGTHWNITIFFKAWKFLRASFMLFIFFDFG